ncbi:hypothetical protein ACT43X_18840 (plasmid) [Acinetobacter baumannii]
MSEKSNYDEISELLINNGFTKNPNYLLKEVDIDGEKDTIMFRQKEDRLILMNVSKNEVLLDQNPKDSELNQEAFKQQFYKAIQEKIGDSPVELNTNSQEIITRENVIEKLDDLYFQLENQDIAPYDAGQFAVDGTTDHDEDIKYYAEKQRQADVYKEVLVQSKDLENPNQDLSNLIKQVENDKQNQVNIELEPTQEKKVTQEKMGQPFVDGSLEVDAQNNNEIEQSSKKIEKNVSQMDTAKDVIQSKTQNADLVNSGAMFLNDFTNRMNGDVDRNGRNSLSFDMDIDGKTHRVNLVVNANKISLRDAESNKSLFQQDLNNGSYHSIARDLKMVTKLYESGVLRMNDRFGIRENPQVRKLIHEHDKGREISTKEFKKAITSPSRPKKEANLDLVGVYDKAVGSNKSQDGATKKALREVLTFDKTDGLKVGAYVVADQALTGGTATAVKTGVKAIEVANLSKIAGKAIVSQKENYPKNAVTMTKNTITNRDNCKQHEDMGYYLKGDKEQIYINFGQERLDIFNKGEVVKSIDFSHVKDQETAMRSAETAIKDITNTLASLDKPHVKEQAKEQIKDTVSEKVIVLNVRDSLKMQGKIGADYAKTSNGLAVARGDYLVLSQAHRQKDGMFSKLELPKGTELKVLGHISKKGETYANCQVNGKSHDIKIKEVHAEYGKQYMKLYDSNADIQSQIKSRITENVSKTTSVKDIERGMQMHKESIAKNASTKDKSPSLDR